MSEALPPAPPGYVHQERLFADLRQRFGPGVNWRFVLWANFLALIPLSLSILLLWLPHQIYVSLGTPLALWPNPTWPLWLKFGLGLGVVFASMMVHELLHALAMILTGHQPVFGFWQGMFMVGVQRDAYLPRNHYLIITLTPLITMTLGGSLLLLLLPAAPGQLLLVALMLNAAASVGDLMVAQRIRRWPTRALFSDHDGIQVFLPETTADD